MHSNLSSSQLILTVQGLCCHGTLLCRARASVVEVCGVLAPPPGMEPPLPALEGETLTTGPPGRSPRLQNPFSILLTRSPSVSRAPACRHAILPSLKSPTVQSSGENIVCDARNSGFLPKITEKTAVLRVDKCRHSVCDQPDKPEGKEQSLG